MPSESQRERSLSNAKDFDPTCDTELPREDAAAGCRTRGEIGDRARDLEDAIISSGAQMEFFHRAMEEFATLGVQFAMRFQKSVGHLRVGAAFWFSREALVLEFARGEHPLADRLRRLAGSSLLSSLYSTAGAST